MNEQDAIDQLADLLDGSGGLHDAPASLGALLTLADTIRDSAVTVAPTDQFRAALRAELLAAAATPETLTDRARALWVRRTAGLRTSVRVTIATATASSMIGSAGVAVAAQEALPGDVLYPLKGITEQARLLLAVDDIAEARLHLLFAAERLEELEASAGRLSEAEMVALLARMDESARRGAEVLLDGAIAGSVDLGELHDFVAVQEAQLRLLVGELPLLVRPAAQDSLELLRRISLSAVGIVPAPDGIPAGVSTPAGGSSAPVGGQAPVGAAPVVIDGGVRIVLPGDGPAVPLPSTDTVVPGAPTVPEPATEEPGEEPDDDEPPFENDGPLSGGQLDHGDGDGDGDAGGGIGTGVSRLPLEDAVEPVEGTTGTDVDTGPVDRTSAAVDDLLEVELEG